MQLVEALGRKGIARGGPLGREAIGHGCPEEQAEEREQGLNIVGHVAGAEPEDERQEALDVGRLGGADVAAEEALGEVREGVGEEGFEAWVGRRERRERCRCGGGGYWQGERPADGGLDGAEGVEEGGGLACVWVRECVGMG